MDDGQSEAKLQGLLQWLQVNGVELRGCDVRCCGPKKGFGIFSTSSSREGILLVVPLDLAITPMRVLQDPIFGPKFRKMLEEGDVDDRFLMILFLTVERLRKDSSWKPYLDILPSTFGNPLWFTDDELLELKGTTLHRATELQKKNLRALFDDKVKPLLKELQLLYRESESEASFEDFLWANSIFWTRALNLPLPHTYVFPQAPGKQKNGWSCLNKDFGAPLAQVSGEMSNYLEDEKGSKCCGGDQEGTEKSSILMQPETVWVEGLVPGIDFCNHDLKAAATWEVDGTGSTTGVPCSMYLLSAGQSALQIGKEICISYGNKGNEELLYLYGFVIDNNPDDYLMLHYPMDAFQKVPFADSKARLLEIQKAEMRCLLPRSFLDHGFFSGSPLQEEHKNENSCGRFCNYSWSGQRKVPSYLNKLVFPEDFLTSLRTIAMQEGELLQVSFLLAECPRGHPFRLSIIHDPDNWSERLPFDWGFPKIFSFVHSLEELVGSGEERQPSDTEVQAAVWEACGDSGALQLLVDLLSAKMMELEEGSGTEASDTELLEKAVIPELSEDLSKNMDGIIGGKELMSRNRWASIVYRRGQKQLTRLFLKEAVHALQLCLSERL